MPSNNTVKRSGCHLGLLVNTTVNVPGNGFHFLGKLSQVRRPIITAFCLSMNGRGQKLLNYTIVITIKIKKHKIIHFSIVQF